MSRCAKGTLSAAIYAKGWVSYFFECMNAPMKRDLDDFVVSRKRARSPSPPPAGDLESMALLMMTKTTDEDNDNQKRLKVAALSKSPEPEKTDSVLQMVESIKPEPSKIKKLVWSLEKCGRGASAPPASIQFTHMPVRSRAASEIPGEAPLFPRRRSVVRMPTIEQSSENSQSMEIDDSNKLKKEGGRKRKTHKHKKPRKRHTRKW